MKTLLTVAVAAAFAFPLAASAAGDKASSAGASNDGGAEAMFKGLDKDKDGSLTKEEVKGSAHDKDFSSLDKDGDGKLSREEHANAPEHKSSAAGASGSSPSGASSSGGTGKPKY
jgi:hypothetical protein